MSDSELVGWDRLRHGGLMLDAARLRRIAEHVPDPLSSLHERELRRLASVVLDGKDDVVDDSTCFVLEKVCGFSSANGAWLRGSGVGAEWDRRTITGESVRPRLLWRGGNDAVLPVFFDLQSRLGIGRGRKAASQAVQWLRAGDERLALLTNGCQWRLIFAGLDFDSWCEWDVDLWFEGGTLSPQVHALRTLISPALWTPPAKDAPCPLLKAILDSRKGQAELSAELGERVREAVELLVQGHGDVLRERCAEVDSAEIYRAAVRMVMRMVVVLFAESRQLLPRDNALYHSAYGLTGLIEELERTAARGGSRLARSWNAWPRVLALFRLVDRGSHHPLLRVPAYGGDLFAPGDPASTDGLIRALAVFENTCFDRELLSDRDVHRMLERITRTKVTVRSGRSGTWASTPVDFSDLSSEYIGILYEGLLDFQLRTVPPGDPIVFLALGNQPALPLSRLEAMDDRALANLLAKIEDTGDDDASGGADEEVEPVSEAEAWLQDAADVEDVVVEETGAWTAGDEEADTGDERAAARRRAEDWARRAVDAGRRARKGQGARTAPGRRAYDEDVARQARHLVVRVILPGEWYLVRWGGTRKGSGTFYTRPGLAVPTVQRTLRPLAYSPPAGPGGAPDRDAPHWAWVPKTPQQILAIKVCDPACGSGTFPVAALRFLTDALYESLHRHDRLTGDPDRPLDEILGLAPAGEAIEDQSVIRLPCRPDDDDFEQRTKAVLRRYVVERSIYGVDLDPLAVELCRLALWIETMDRQLPFSFLDHKIKCGNALVGAWFDQFQHYPVMAWKNREGGDRAHTNGVHFKKDDRGQALKSFVQETLTPDLRTFLAGRTLFSEDLQESAATVHAEALATLSRLHDLPIQDSAERAHVYRQELVGSAAYRSLKSAMDLWCACWFWPADELANAPLPTTLADPAVQTRAIAGRIAGEKRFFHWELEFADVFCAPGSGFDAVVGNPPWDIAKPNSMEFFSNFDPLYRSYGKQDALRFQGDYFQLEALERAWLDYSGDFRAQSNFMKFAASPFGDPEAAGMSGDRFSIARGNESNAAHARWREARAGSCGFADSEHPFRHQGSADLNLYKAFIEQAHALLRLGGRLGFIVPSGLYSDHGSSGLRQLFLDRCRWEWLFGFENRERVFDIHRSFKFNPVIIEKGGATQSIRCSFMRHSLEDWEWAEGLATQLARLQIERFSPDSRAILEIQGSRDLEVLETVYANSVLLGDGSQSGWGIKYATEFHMTNDSALFPIRTKWEADGYRPDEYSRWLKGDWRPIDELWVELDVALSDGDLGPPPQLVEFESPTREDHEDVAQDSWIDSAHSAATLEHTPAAPSGRVDSLDSPSTGSGRPRRPPPVATFLNPSGVVEPGRGPRDVPAYGSVPIARADVPPGIILSRDADAWIREDRVEDVALPLYQGIMVQPFMPSARSWRSGTGLTATWDANDPWRLIWNPQYLVSGAVAVERVPRLDTCKIGYREVARSTDARSFIGAVLPQFPCGHKVPTLTVGHGTSAGPEETLVAAGLLNSFAFDWLVRQRLGAAALAWYVLKEACLPRPGTVPQIAALVARLNLISPVFAPVILQLQSGPFRAALTTCERLRLRVVVDAVAAAAFSLSLDDLRIILADCWLPRTMLAGRSTAPKELDPRGFWRVDRDMDPELRHTVLTLVAFHDLQEKINACGGDRATGIDAFLRLNDGEGWMLPETLRLTDYGLGHDERAQLHQPVASRLGPRYFDWQLSQTHEESWRECHLHARNLLGEAGYRRLLADIEARARGEAPVVEIVTRAAARVEYESERWLFE